MTERSLKKITLRNKEIKSVAFFQSEKAILLSVKSDEPKVVERLEQMDFI